MNTDNYSGIGSRGYTDRSEMQNAKRGCGCTPSGNANSAMLKKIQALSFAMVELELYLDAHPDCNAALEHYEKLTKEYNELCAIYENTVAPISHEGAIGETWTWVKNPWPWQNEEV